MAEKIVSWDDFKLNTITEILRGKEGVIHVNFNLHYDDLLDSMMTLWVPLELEHALFPIDDYVGLVYLVDTHEIVGLYVDDFQSMFLQPRPKLKNLWMQNHRSLEMVLELQMEMMQESIKAANEYVGAAKARQFTMALAS
jgi:hypothetical protein